MHPEQQQQRQQQSSQAGSQVLRPGGRPEGRQVRDKGSGTEGASMVLLAWLRDRWDMMLSPTCIDMGVSCEGLAAWF